MIDYKVINGMLTDVNYKEGESMSCSCEHLTSLCGCPKKIDGVLECSYNDLTDLRGSPEEVIGSFDCAYNRNLTSLEGGPKYVGAGFFCEFTNLTSLKGAPLSVKDGFFSCSCNWNLEDISDLPEDVTELCIGGCSKIRKFPNKIKDTLDLVGVSPEVVERIKKEPTLMIVKEFKSDIKDKKINHVIIKKRPDCLNLRLHLAFKEWLNFYQTRSPGMQLLILIIIGLLLKLFGLYVPDQCLERDAFGYCEQYPED